jgi:hypothetical protein
MTMPPGWYPDPRRGGGSAYWDGSRWVFERGDAQRQIDVVPPEQRQPTESESDEDREWAKDKGNALALLTASYHGAQFDVLRRVLEDVTDSTGDPIDQLTGQLTQVTNLLISMTFIAAALADKVAELSEEDREAVLEAIEKLITSRED